jgi:hypothetical protein
LFPTLLLSAFAAFCCGISSEAVSSIKNNLRYRYEDKTSGGNMIHR